VSRIILRTRWIRGLTKIVDQMAQDGKDDRFPFCLIDQ
jgi:hypothetical protein